MALLIVSLGVALFVGVHIIPMMPGWRAALVNRLGEGGYKAGFAVLSLLGLIGAIVAYRFTPHVLLWASPPPLRIVTAALMLAAVLMFAGAKGVPWFKRIVRHPMLWAIGLLGLAHLLVNGDVAGVILFGGLAVFGFAWQGLTDRRDAEVDPAGFAQTRRTTSFWPFAKWNARTDPVTLRPLVIGAIVYVALILLHPWLFGAPVILR
ncbi:MAG: NnrU family protein [Geminicoccaceae bacterium]